MPALRRASASLFPGAPAPHTASIRRPSTQNAVRMLQVPMRKRPRNVSTAPDAPTAPPMTPVARPLRSAYHFCAQDMTEGYKNAQPSPTGTLNTP